MNDPHGIDAEQAALDVMFTRLDAVRTEAEVRLAATRRAGPSGSPQNRSERDAFATLYEDRIAQLDAVEDRLCFGKLDLADRTRLYVGRIGLSDSEHAPLLTDWRAPAARAFYAATAAEPSGVVLRRHLTTQGRKVIAVEDDVLDIRALQNSGEGGELAGEGALLAALAARRTGKMTDIVATIQAEQDAAIRAPMSGALVVQGGPGTGKTAVALHRAAYLLYHHREQLESSGVLVIGPSPTFLRYIDQVLPSLGETGAIATTLSGLVKGVDTSAREGDAVAAVKGRTGMARVIANAVRERQRLPRSDQEISIDGRTAVIRRADIADAQAKARRDGAQHNVARGAFAKDMIARLAAQFAEEMDSSLAPEDMREIERDVRDSREVKIALNLAWLPVTPQRLLSDLFSRPYLLDHAAPRLTKADRALLARPATAPFTDADVPLLDEAAELLGDLPGGARPPRDVSDEDVDFAKQVLETFGGGEMMTAKDLARRMAVGTTRLTVAERASRDRTWTYGHIVVDEAQELSPMAWRMLLRRCPLRSFTIVGDVAQTASSAGARWWPDMLDPVFGEHWTQRDLTVSYRIPAAVAEVAQSYGRAAGLPVSQLTAARDLEDAVLVSRVDDPVASGILRARAHAHRLSATGGGRVALIVPDGDLARARSLDAAVGRAAPDAESEEGAVVSFLGPRDAKGLEFDVAVVAEPAAIAMHPGDLYVALTRPTSVLDIVYSLPLPAGISDPATR
jgi:DNA helicase IV